MCERRFFYFKNKISQKYGRRGRGGRRGRRIKKASLTYSYSTSPSPPGNFPQHLPFRGSRSLEPPRDESIHSIQPTPVPLLQHTIIHCSLFFNSYVFLPLGWRRSCVIETPCLSSEGVLSWETPKQIRSACQNHDHDIFEESELPTPWIPEHHWYLNRLRTCRSTSKREMKKDLRSELKFKGFESKKT